MTKRHFIALADATRQLLGQQTTQYDEGMKDYVSFPLFGDEQKEAIRRMLADFCGDQNPRFDRWRWLSYLSGECGPNGGKVAA